MPRKEKPEPDVGREDVPFDITEPEPELAPEPEPEPKPKAGYLVQGSALVLFPPYVPRETTYLPGSTVPVRVFERLPEDKQAFHLQIGQVVKQ